MKDAWRTCPSGVHSENSTSATRVGCTHRSPPGLRFDQRPGSFGAPLDGGSSCSIFDSLSLSAAASSEFRPVPTLPTSTSCPSGLYTPRIKLPTWPTAPVRSCQPRTIGHFPDPERAMSECTRVLRRRGRLANPRVLEIEEVKSAPCAPVSHHFVERLIGTIRGEHLDRVFFWNAVDFARKLDEFIHHYNAHRVRRSLDGITPAQRADAPGPAPASLDRFAWQQHCRGLFQTRLPFDWD